MIRVQFWSQPNIDTVKKCWYCVDDVIGRLTVILLTSLVTFHSLSFKANKSTWLKNFYLHLYCIQIHFFIFFILYLKWACMCKLVCVCMYLVSLCTHLRISTGGPRYLWTFLSANSLIHEIGQKWQFSSQNWTFYLRIQDLRSKMMEHIYRE